MARKAHLFASSWGVQTASWYSRTAFSMHCLVPTPPSPPRTEVLPPAQSQCLLPTFHFPSTTLNAYLIRHHQLLKQTWFSFFLKKETKLGGQVTRPVSQANQGVVLMQTQPCLKSESQFRRLQAAFSLTLDCPSPSPRPIIGTRRSVDLPTKSESAQRLPVSGVLRRGARA